LLRISLFSKKKEINDASDDHSACQRNELKPTESSEKVCANDHNNIADEIDDE